MAVTCAMTLYDLFGIGRVAPGTGIFHARAPAPGQEPASLGPVMITRPADRTFRMAVAGSGGLTGASAKAHLAAKAILEKLPFGKAMASARIHPDTASASILTESGESDSHVEALVRRGHAVERGHTLGRLNAVFCPAGLPADSAKRSDCSAAADPRGGGLGRVFLFERE